MRPGRVIFLLICCIVPPRIYISSKDLFVISRLRDGYAFAIAHFNHGMHISGAGLGLGDGVIVPVLYCGGQIVLAILLLGDAVAVPLLTDQADIILAGLGLAGYVMVAFLLDDRPVTPAQLLADFFTECGAFPLNNFGGIAVARLLD